MNTAEPVNVTSPAPVRWWVRALAATAIALPGGSVPRTRRRTREVESGPGDLALDLHRVVSKLSLGLRRRDIESVAAGGLTLAQLSILDTLLDRGPTSVSNLAALERVRVPTTTVATNRLETMGLVARFRDQADHRIVMVGITQRGVTVHEASLRDRRAAVDALLTRLSESDRETLSSAMASLKRLAEESGR